MRYPLLVLVGVLVGGASAPALAQEQSVQTIALNPYKRVLDGQWQGIRYASDGNVYFGSSTHSANHGAAFFKFDPRTQQLTMLAEDISIVCGDDPTVSPQGKLHSDIVEANGWLYMSTHFSSERPGAYDRWSGSHVIGYELATGQFRDYGAVHPNYTSYSGIGVDPVRNYLYVFVTGQYPHDVSYIYRIHTVTGEKANLGQVGRNFDGSLAMFVDRRGDAWFSVYSQNGALMRVHGDTGRIDTFPNALPLMYRWDRDELVSGSAQATRFIMWMQPIDGDRAVFFLGWNGGMLYEFDASKPIATGQAFKSIKHIGYTEGLALAANRVFYYQRDNRGFGQQEYQDFHLLSVSLVPGSGHPIIDHGLMRVQDGRLVWRTPSMTTDGATRVFMASDWWTLPGDLGTLRYRYNGGAEIYEPLPRGQFFAVADVEIPGGSELSVLTLAPRLLTGGTTSSTNEVSLSAPAPAGGIAVALSSSNPALADPQPTVIVPEGAISATFALTTYGVTADETVTITASDPAGNVYSTSITVAPASLATLTVVAEADAGSPTIANRVVLTGAAGPAGRAVELSSSNPVVVSVPTSILVPYGATEAGFTVSTTPVSVATAVTITARLGSIVRTAVVTVHPVVAKAIVLSPAAVDAGGATTGNTVTLTRRAPPGGAAVTVVSSHPAIAAVPSPVMVAAGELASAPFTIVTSPTAAPATIALIASFGGVSRTSYLYVTPVVPTALTLSPTAIDAGLATTLNRVTLSRPAPPAGAEISLTSSHPAVATVPSIVVVAPGATTSPDFVIQTHPVIATTYVTITARYAGVARTATLTLYPVTIGALTLSSSAANAGTPVASNRATLTRRALPGGALVSLSSSHPAVASVPSAVMVPAGETTSPAFTIATFPVSVTTAVTITASYGGVSRTANVTVYPVTLNTLALPATSVNAGTSLTTNWLALGRAAPPGGAHVQLSSSHPAVASVPATVIVAAAATTSGHFTIATAPVVTNTVVTITASFGGVSRSVALTVYAVTAASVALSPTSVNAGTPTTGNRVTLTRGAPPGGAAVALTSSHPAIASVPSSVVVPAGGTTSPTFVVTTGLVTSTTTVTITAAYGGVARTAMLTVYPVAVQSLTLSPTTLRGGTASTSNRVTLDRAAPPGGAVVLLTSSHPALVTVPASITVAAGWTVSPMFAIATTPVGVATPVVISATYAGSTRSMTLTLIP